MTDKQIQEWIESNMFHEDGTPMIDTQVFYEGAKWMRKVFTETHYIDEWSGLFDKNGQSLFEGDEVLIFNQKARIVFELGAFCYQYDAGVLGVQTTAINGSNITIDSDFKCLEIEKI